MVAKNLNHQGKLQSKQRKALLSAFGRYNTALLTLGAHMAADLKLTLSEMIVLDHLYIGGEATPSALAQRTRLTSGALTALLDRLEERGFVRRFPHPTDRRSVMVAYIPQQRETSGRLHQVLGGLQVFSKHSDLESQHIVQAFLEHMTEVVERSITDHS